MAVNVWGDAGVSDDGEQTWLPADISVDGRFQQGRVVVDRRAGQLRAEAGTRVVQALPLADLEEVQAQILVGNGHLVVIRDEEPLLFARYSPGHANAYAAAARQLNQLIAAEKPTGPFQLPPARLCPSCRRRFPDESRVCPRCLNRLAVLGRLLRLALPHGALLAASTLLFVVLTALQLVGPQLQRLLIDDVLLAAGGEVRLLLLILAAMAGVQLGSVGFGILRRRVMVTLAGRLSRDLRRMVYERLQELSLRYIMRRKTGDLMNRVSGDTRTLQRFIEGQAAMGIQEGLVLVGIGIILFSYSWQLAVLVIGPAPFVLLYASLVRGRIYHMYRRQWRAWDRANSLLQDVLSGIRVVKACGQEEREARRFVRYSQEMADITAANEKSWNTLFPTLGYVMGVGNFLVLFYGGHLVLGEEMLVGELVQFSAYAGMLYGPLQFMSFFPRWLTEALTASERVFEVVDVQPDVADRKGARRHRIRGHVAIEGLTFGYERHQPVLHDIDLEVQPGEMIGLVGHSGAGKSTLINLICRFYDVDEGAIRIDGIDVRDLAQESLRRQIGVVLQETFLFAGTVYDNIAYARPEATPRDVVRAARIANAHDFIVGFKDGYDTYMGERGQRLSGGERQRIAIARAILHDPRLLILDEATASVDTETEYQIQQALARLVAERTTFAIAHRLSTLRNADRLVVLDQGRVAETGTHAELMAGRGIYHHMVMEQRRMSRVKGVEG